MGTGSAAALLWQCGYAGIAPVEDVLAHSGCEEMHERERESEGWREGWSKRRKVWEARLAALP